MSTPPSQQQQQRQQQRQALSASPPSLSFLLHQAAVSESHARALYNSGDRDAALAAAIRAAEIYIQARSLAPSAEQNSLNKKFSSLLAIAERWKKGGGGGDASSGLPRNATKRSLKEEKLLWESSKIGRGVFPPWEGPPDQREFEGEQFSDDKSEMSMSDTQKEILDRWKRPREAWGEKATVWPQEEEGGGRKVDLTQDVVSDCSVVASLCAAIARREAGFDEIVEGILYPQNDKVRATESPNGKYIVKLFFNGCYRKVVIDDFLPTSMQRRALHVMCRNHPTAFGYALIEKAYLKLMGGYDFPGSNSGTDLRVLTGWIPEHLFLQSDDIVFGSLWRRLTKAWSGGDVLITLGTGRMTAQEESELGLVSEHDYAVLGLREENNSKMLLVKNPWSEGRVWNSTPAEHEYNSDDDFDNPAPKSFDTKSAKDALQPGVFWISLENVCRNFTSLYLNWNPALFAQMHETHFSWDLATKVSETSFAWNPQFSITNVSASSTPVWLLLSRHLGLPNAAADGMVRSGFISLYLFDKSGKKTFLSSPSLERTAYVDSPQVLLRLDNVSPKTTYTLVVSSQELSKTLHHFSLFAYSLTSLSIEPAQEPYPYTAAINAAWSFATAGGNVNSAEYPKNPQARVTLGSATQELTLLLESPCPHPVHIKLIHSSGERVAAVTARDIIAESGEYRRGEYRRGAALATARFLPAGMYTAVASTFEPGQYGQFTLTLFSTTPDAAIELLPGETAGCYETLREGAWSEGVTCIAIRMEVERLMKVWVRAKCKGCPLKVRLEEEEEKILVSSGDRFLDLPMGVKTEKVDLWAGRGGAWIVVERLGEGEEDWAVQVVSEGRIWVAEEEEERSG